MNDAAALAQADLGIALGSGTDAAAWALAQDVEEPLRPSTRAPGTGHRWSRRTQ